MRGEADAAIACVGRERRCAAQSWSSCLFTAMWLSNNSLPDFLEFAHSLLKAPFLSCNTDTSCSSLPASLSKLRARSSHRPTSSLRTPSSCLLDLLNPVVRRTRVVLQLCAHFVELMLLPAQLDLQPKTFLSTSCLDCTSCARSLRFVQAPLLVALCFCFCFF